MYYIAVLVCCGNILLNTTQIKDIAKRPLLGGKEGNFKKLILEKEKLLQFFCAVLTY